MRRFLLAAALVLASVSMLAGCDDRPCLKSHLQMMPIVMPSATPGMTTTQFMWISVCDEYGPATR